MQNKELEKVFDEAFCAVTKKLVKLDLQRVQDVNENKEQMIKAADCREVIETKGYIRAKLICCFSNELFHYIVNTMNGGEPPSEEVAPLFLNEYINIMCGSAVSKLNNLFGHSSRLSVPLFYQGGAEMQEQLEMQRELYFAYYTEMGILHIFMNYSLEENRRR